MYLLFISLNRGYSSDLSLGLLIKILIWWCIILFLHYLIVIFLIGIIFIIISILCCLRIMLFLWFNLWIPFFSFIWDWTGIFLNFELIQNSLLLFIFPVNQIIDFWNLWNLMCVLNSLTLRIFAFDYQFLFELQTVFHFFAIYGMYSWRSIILINAGDWYLIGWADELLILQLLILLLIIIFAFVILIHTLFNSY